jgi:hypothetical protein
MQEQDRGWKEGKGVVCVKMIEGLVQPVENVQDEDAVGDVNAKVDEGVGETLHLQAVVVHVKIALNKVPEGGIDVEGASLPIADEAILQGQPGSAGGVATLTGHCPEVQTRWCRRAKT